MAFALAVFMKKQAFINAGKIDTMKVTLITLIKAPRITRTDSRYL